MKILSIGSDRNLFKEGSFVYKRTFSYAKYADNLFIIVFSLRSYNLNTLKEQNFSVIPTNSFSRLLYVFDSIRIGYSILKKEEDLKDFVITCQDPFESGLSGLVLSLIFNLPLHIQIHTDFLNPYFYRESFLNKVRVFISKIVLKKAKFIRVVSNRILNSLKENNLINKNQKTEVLPIALQDKDLFLNSEKYNEFDSFGFDKKIISVSRLEKEKRVSDIILALKNVTVKYPKTGLFIVGSGSQRTILESLTKSLGLEKNVVFLGQKNEGEIFKLLKSADIFINPSSYEGYGLSVIEAGLSGLPVISSQSGLYPEILDGETNSLVFKVGDIDDLSVKIERLILDNNFSSSIAENLKRDLQKSVISQDEYIQRYINELKNCL